MRLLVLSTGTLLILVLGVAGAQPPADNKNIPQIPYGQTDKDFGFPYYQDNELKFTLSAATATGTTMNRAEATNLKIEIYDQGKVTTTITSPKADLYPSDQRMRTKNTVLIKRNDMEITAQNCDFDLLSKKYFLHGNVRVILKNFDANFNPPSGSSPSTGSTPTASTAPVLPPLPPGSHSSYNNPLADTPGAYANTNIAPTPQSKPANP